MLKILLKIWPALMPALIYFIWYVKNYRNRDVKIRDEFLEKKDRYRFYAILSCGIIFILLVVYYVAIVEPTPERALIDSRLPLDASTGEK
jgi:type II secretory pathway component PulM